MSEPRCYTKPPVNTLHKALRSLPTLEAVGIVAQLCRADCKVAEDPGIQGWIEDNAQLVAFITRVGDKR